MSEETARKICEQMTDDIDDLCNCCRENEKDKSCIGCRELAIKTILQENEKGINAILELIGEIVDLKRVLKEIREYINKMEFDEYGVFYDIGKNLFEYEPNFKDKALEIIDKAEIGENNG